MSNTTAPRRIIRGYEGLRPFTGYSRTKMQELVALGKFPAPMQLGPRAIGWFEDEVAAWQSRALAEAEAD